MSDDISASSVKENVKNTDTWIRGVFIIIYGVIFYLLFWILWVVVIFQFLMKVLLGNLNDNLMDFSGGLTRYAYQILQYVTFRSEERPWPFGPWPAAGHAAADELPAPASPPPASDEPPPGAG